jgi:hypothetical protein
MSAAPPATPQGSPDRFQPLAGLLAVAFPGLGHVALGDWKRGAAIGTGVLGLFFGGLLIGGIDAVDAQEDRVWFIGQALNGPIAFAADHVHQNYFKGFAYDPGTQRTVRRSAYPGERIEWRPPPNAPAGTPAVPVIVAGGTPPLAKSLGRANELGTLFITIGGMLNLLVIIDASFNRPKRERDAEGQP